MKCTRCGKEYNGKYKTCPECRKYLKNYYQAKKKVIKDLTTDLILLKHDALTKDDFFKKWDTLELL